MQFFAFCQDNAPWQIERTPQGGVVVKAPTRGESSHRCLELAFWEGVPELPGCVFDLAAIFDATL